MRRKECAGRFSFGEAQNSFRAFSVSRHGVVFTFAYDPSASGKTNDGLDPGWRACMLGWVWRRMGFLTHRSQERVANGRNSFSVLEQEGAQAANVERKQGVANDCTEWCFSYLVGQLRKLLRAQNPSPNFPSKPADSHSWFCHTVEAKAPLSISEAKDSMRRKGTVNLARGAMALRQLHQSQPARLHKLPASFLSEHVGSHPVLSPPITLLAYSRNHTYAVHFQLA